jgi:hypothetical protein
MKLKFVAAAALVAFGGSSFAATTGEDSFIDGTSFVYTFSASKILAAETYFGFSLNSADTDFTSFFTPGGSYSVVGGISGTRYAISSVKLNGTAWVPTTGSDINLGSLSIGPMDTLFIEVVGARTGSGANFNGQLVLTPVPEPETYAMMLAGLGALGFLARRRQG